MDVATALALWCAAWWGWGPVEWKRWRYELVPHVVLIPEAEVSRVNPP